jgi:hypothetical protein
MEHAPASVPRHVAIIMDGNGRWAEQRGLERTRGHEAGERALFDVVEGALEAGIRYPSLRSRPRIGTVPPRRSTFCLASTANYCARGAKTCTSAMCAFVVSGEGNGCLRMFSRSSMRPKR